MARATATGVRAYARHPLAVPGLYLLLVSPTLAAGSWSMGHVTLALVHVGAAAACLVALRRWPEAGWRLAWIPLLALPLLYWEIPFLNQGLAPGYHDPWVSGLERALFGGSPAAEAAGRFPSTALSEFLHLCYIAYYPLIYVPPLVLCLHGRLDEFRTSVTALSAAMAACFVVFVYFPVQGPRYFGPPEGVPDGPIRSFTLAILEGASSRGAAFPSSHMAIAAAQALVTLRFQPRLGIVVTGIGIGLGLGAVYGGFHYAVDMLVGGGVGSVAALGALALRGDDVE